MLKSSPVNHSRRASDAWHGRQVLRARHVASVHWLPSWFSSMVPACAPHINLMLALPTCRSPRECSVALVHLSSSRSAPAPPRPRLLGSSPQSSRKRLRFLGLARASIFLAPATEPAVHVVLRFPVALLCSIMPFSAMILFHR